MEAALHFLNFKQFYKRKISCDELVQKKLSTLKNIEIYHRIVVD